MPGTRLAIFWPQEKIYYKATVKTERPRKRENFLISYDEKKSLADREWIDLHRHKFRILEIPITATANMGAHEANEFPVKTEMNDYPAGVVVVQTQLQDHLDEPDDNHHHPIIGHEQHWTTLQPMSAPSSCTTRRKGNDGAKLREKMTLPRPIRSISDTNEDFTRNTPNCSTNHLSTNNEQRSRTPVLTLPSDFRLVSSSRTAAKTTTTTTIAARVVSERSNSDRSLLQNHVLVSAASSKLLSSSSVSSEVCTSSSPGSNNDKCNVVVVNSKHHHSDSISDAAFSELNSACSSTVSSPRQPLLLEGSNFVFKSLSHALSSFDASHKQHHEHAEEVETIVTKNKPTHKIPSDYNNNEFNVLRPERRTLCVNNDAIADNEKLASAKNKPNRATESKKKASSGESDSHELKQLSIDTQLLNSNDCKTGENICCDSSQVKADSLTAAAFFNHERISLIRDDDDDDDDQSHSLESNACRSICNSPALIKTGSMSLMDNEEKELFSAAVDDKITASRSPAAEECVAVEKCLSSDANEVNMNGADIDDEEGVIIDPESDPTTRSVVCSLIEVGSRVSVYWSDEDKFYAGTITDRSFRGKPFYLEYDDGEEEWIDLRKHRFRLLQTRQNPKTDDYAEFRRTRQIHRAPEKFLDETCKKKKIRSKGTVDSVSKNSAGAKGKIDMTAVLTNSPTRTIRKNRKAAFDAFAEKQRLQIVDSCGKGDDSDDDHWDNEIESDYAKIKIGSRVAVWWDWDKKYYSGVVRNKRNHKKPFLLVYDDGEAEEWIDFRQQKFKLKQICPLEKKKRGRRKKDDDFCPDDIDKVRIGSRVAVWWSDVAIFCNGTVTQRRVDDKPFFIEYDNDELGHWIDFSKHTFRLLGGETEPQQKSTENEKKNGTRKANNTEKSSSAQMKKKTFKRKRSIDSDKGRNDEKKRRNEVIEPTDCDEQSDSDDVSLGISVGTRVAVYWEGDSKYYEGVVTRERKNSKKRHYLEYDDGEAAHWIDIKEHWVRVLATGDKGKGKSPSKKFTTSRKFAHACALKKSAGRSSVADSSDFHVGSRVKVWWKGDLKFYEGNVLKVGKRRVFVQYDDDEEEWVEIGLQAIYLIGKDDKSKVEDFSEEEEQDGVKSDASSDADSSDSEDHMAYKDFVYGNVDNVHVGSKLAIWWSKEKKYFNGKVKKMNDSRKPYFILYDDGDEEWTDLRKRYFRFLDS